MNRAKLEEAINSVRRRLTIKDAKNLKHYAYNRALMDFMEVQFEDMDKFLSDKRLSEGVDVEALEQTTYELFDELTGNGSITDRDTIEQLVKHILSTVSPQESDYVNMPKELTSENGAKAEFIGEYSTSETHTCIECGGSGLYDEEDPDPDKCEICEGRGTLTFTQTIDWTTTKQMYKDFVKFFTAPKPPVSR